MATSVKEHWQNISDKHRDTLKADLDAIMERSKDLMVGAAVIGGGFALSYFMIKKIGGKKKVKVTHKKDDDNHTREVTVEKQPSMLTSIGHVVLTELTLFGLTIVKEKLIEYLKTINTEDQEDEQYSDHAQ